MTTLFLPKVSEKDKESFHSSMSTFIDNEIQVYAKTKRKNTSDNKNK